RAPPVLRTPSVRSPRTSPAQAADVLTDGAKDALEQAIERFLTHLDGERRSPRNTVAAYRRDLAQLVQFAREKRGRALAPSELDILLLRGWLGTLARTHAPSSIARKISAARALLRYLEKRGEVSKNAAAELSLPKVRRPLPTFLNVDA